MDLLRDVRLRLSKEHGGLILANYDSKFNSVTTDKGILRYDGELREGLDVYVEGEGGMLVPAPNGVYTLQDDSQKDVTVTVEDGIVTDIKVPTTDDATQTELHEETENSEGTSENTAPQESVSLSSYNELKAIVDILLEQVQNLVTQMATTREEITTTRENFSKALSSSKGKPIAESNSNPTSISVNTYKPASLQTFKERQAQL